MTGRKTYHFKGNGGRPALGFETSSKEGINASRGMTNYDRRSRPVPEEQRTAVPYHLSPGYLAALKQLEATKTEGLAEAAELAAEFERVRSMRKRDCTERSHNPPY